MKLIDKIKYSPFYAFSLLPSFLLYALSDFAFFILFYLIKYRRKVVVSNLKNSFPEKDEKEIFKIERDFYRHFCDIMVGSIKVLGISKKEIKRRFSVKNPELIQKIFEEKRSIILYTAHQGDWEWLAFLPLFVPHQTLAFYQPLSNKYFDKLMKIIRERFGVICVESNKGYKSIMTFAQNEILTMSYVIGDQSPPGGSSKHWLNFLNQETAFLVGADRIAKKSNQVVVFPAFRKTGRGCYELEFKLITDEPKIKLNYEIIDEYAALLENTIKTSPDLWLWSHRRWKLKKDN